MVRGNGSDDRFFVRARTEYPSETQERELLSRSVAGFDARDLVAAGVERVGTADDVQAAQREVRAIYVAEALQAYDGPAGINLAGSIWLISALA